MRRGIIGFIGELGGVEIRAVDGVDDSFVYEIS